MTGLAFSEHGATATSPPSGRVVWIDVAKGLAIILVVYGHSFRGLDSAGYIGADSGLGWVDYLIYTFHMPLFFGISGVLAMRPGSGNGKSFWIGRIGAIVIPYLVWMTVQMMALVAFSGLTNEGAVPIGLSTYLYRPVSPFWFLYALVLCHLFTHFVFRLGRAPMLGLAVILYLLGQVTEGGLARDVSWGLLYFSLGGFLSEFIRSVRVAGWLGRLRSFLLLASAWAICGVTCLLAGINNEWALPAAVLGCLLISSLSVHLARMLAGSLILAFVIYLGRISLTVLVVHILGTAAARIILGHVFGIDDVVVHLVLGTTLGIGVAVVLQVVSTRLNLRSILGLPHVGKVGQWPKLPQSVWLFTAPRPGATND